MTEPTRNQDDRAWQVLDRVVQSSVVEQRRARRWGIFFKLLTFAYLFFALWLFYPGRLGPTAVTSVSHTAVVRLEGVIADGQNAAADTVAKGMRRAFENEGTRAVMLVINSPGGSPVQSEYVYNEIRRLRGAYPDIELYAVISDIGASGAYYIASAADKIYASPASLVGSIGVVSGSFGFVDAMEQLGVERRLFTAGEHKGLLDPFSPLKEEEGKFWQEVLNQTHQQFIDRVKTGRGDRLADDPQIFSGLVWTGEKAQQLGLVDGLASPGQVARDIIGEEKIVDFTVRPNPIDALLGRLGASVGEGVARAFSRSAGTPMSL